MRQAAIGRKDTVNSVRKVRALFEALESRQLLSTAFSAHVNFQPAGAAKPAGYVADTGAVYGLRNGLTYGWNIVNTNARERNVNANQLYDTFALMQAAGQSFTWQIAVPNGTYRVHAAAGDGSDLNSVYSIAAEGRRLIYGTPTSTRRWISSTMDITVSDGKLTISNFAGGKNNKIDFIDITPATSVTTPPPTTTLRVPAAPGVLSAIGTSTSQIRLNWKDNATNEYGYYVRRSSDGGKTYARITTLAANTNTFLDSGRAAGATYYYRVASYNQYGESASLSASGKTKSPPASPGSFTASGASTSQIRLNWKDNATNEYGYYIQRSSNGGKTYARITTLAANSNTFLDSGRAAGTTYYYRVASYNQYGASAYIGATGKTPSPVVSKPASPSLFTASGASTSQIRLNWKDNATNEYGYYVQRSTNGGVTYARITTLAANSHTFLDSGRAAGTTYYYRVASYNQFGTSAYISANGKTASAGPVAPAAPSLLSATGASTSQIRLNWKDNSFNESSFYVERSTDNGATYLRVATLSANTKSYLDGGRTSGKRYYYRVASHGSSGTSAWAKASAAPLSAPSTPSTPDTPPPPSSGNSGYYDGLNVSGDPNKAIPILRDLKFTAVRIWMSISSWGSRPSSSSAFKNAIAYHNAGFKVTLLTTCVSPPTYSQAKAYFDWAQNVSGVKNAVDFWEIQNEPDLTVFYKGTVTSYVKNELKGAWDSLHANSEKVIGGGVLFTRSAQEAKDAGYLSYVDYANAHPYNSTIARQLSDWKGIKNIFNSKPMVATEWNFHYVNDLNVWSGLVRDIHPYIKTVLSGAYYFRLVIGDSMSGKAGLVNSSTYAHNTLFYNAVKSWNGQPAAAASVMSVSAAAPTATASTSKTSGSTSTSAADSLFADNPIL